MPTSALKIFAKLIHRLKERPYAKCVYAHGIAIECANYGQLWAAIDAVRLCRG